MLSKSTEEKRNSKAFSLKKAWIFNYDFMVGTPRKSDKLPLEFLHFLEFSLLFSSLSVAKAFVMCSVVVSKSSDIVLQSVNEAGSQYDFPPSED